MLRGQHALPTKLVHMAPVTLLFIFSFRALTLLLLLLGDWATGLELMKSEAAESRNLITSAHIGRGANHRQIHERALLILLRAFLTKREAVLLSVDAGRSQSRNNTTALPRAAC